MMRYIKYIFVLAITMLMSAPMAQAQSDRTFIRQGNKAYRTSKWPQAETQYRKALSKNAQNSQAAYNLGCALMMQQKDSVAFNQFADAAKMETSKTRRAMGYHNMGVIMQNHQDYAKAIDCYKMALRNNPADNATRYNLALCKKLLKEQQQQNKQNNKNKDKKQQDKNQNKQQDRNKQQDKKNDNKDNKKDNSQGKGQQEKPDQRQMSKDNAEQLLNAAIQQEQATKQKLQKAMSQPRRKAYDKNW